MSRNLLIICGVSGSGKSTLEKNLINDYPAFFHKWQQVSTRKMREGERFGDPYIFVQPDTFTHLQNKLVGCLGCTENSLFKDKYGSIPDFIETKMSTVILAEEAIYDIKYKIDHGFVDVDKFFILGLDVNFEDLDQKDLREGRSKEFIEKERTVLQHADYVFTISNGKYLNPRDVVNMLKEKNFF